MTYMTLHKSEIDCAQQNAHTIFLTYSVVTDGEWLGCRPNLLNSIFFF